MRSKALLVLTLICLPVAVMAAVPEAVHGVPANMTHRMMMLVFQLGGILFAAKLGSVFFQELRLPGVLGELVAGMVIGPHLLGALAFPGFPQGLFPMEGSFPVSAELYGFCSVAAVVLLFTVGLETDFKLFIRYSFAGSFVAVGGIVASFVLGDLLCVLFSARLFGASLGFLSPPCLFLGIISTATSVGITARILSEKGKLDSPEGVTILAGAVIDDVLGIIMLAVGLGVIAASKAGGTIDWAHIGIIAAKAIGIWLGATAIALLASRQISVLLKWFKDRSSIAIMALGMALILSGIFEEAGLAMIIGAYVMGLALSKTDISRVIKEKLDPIYAFMVPVFFAVMGMLVDLRLFGSRNVLVFGLTYTLVAVLAKIVGCGVPALFCNFNLRGALRVGVGMVPRGEVALIISGIGLASGVLTSEVFSVGVLMALFTTLIAPPLLVLLFGNPATGLREPVAVEKAGGLSFRFPSPPVAELLINKLRVIFESEGFFVHTLSREKRIYQARKDNVVIGFQDTGTDIVFECGKEQTSLVNTAMYEVLVELEQMVKDLRKPVDTAVLARRLQQDVPGTSVNLSMEDYLSRDTLDPALKGNTKREIIDELLRILGRNGLVKDIDAARKAVLSREETMCTGMQYGSALPHGTTDAVDRLVCAVGMKREGIDFGAIDRQPSKIFVLTLTPQAGVTPHVQFLSTIAQLLDKEGSAALLACRTAEEMYAMLTSSTRGSPR